MSELVDYFERWRWLAKREVSIRYSRSLKRWTVDIPGKACIAMGRGESELDAINAAYEAIARF